jgi:very-short-patch-repair endonuclease
MAKSTVTCRNCSTSFEKENREINRAAKLGREHFCSLACTAQFSNEPRKAREVTKTCPTCKKQFESSTKAKAATFCSSRCATLGSETEERRQGRSRGGRTAAGNLLSTHEVLKRREAPKYAELEKALLGRRHEFEFPLEGYVFDLALFDQDVLLEFDGRYHEANAQRTVDQEKDRVATKHGFRIVRVEVPSGEVIPVTVLQEV